MRRHHPAIFASGLLALGVPWAVSDARAAEPVVVAEGPTTPLMSHTVQATLEVDIQKASSRIVEIARSLGGQPESVTDARVSVRLPTAQVDTLFDRLRPLGALRVGRATTVDLTPAAARIAAELRSAQEAHERKQRLQRLARDVPSGLELSAELERSSAHIADTEERLQALRRKATTTVIQITIAAPSVETFNAPRLPFAWLDQMGLPRLQDTTSYERQSQRELRLAMMGQVLLKGAYVRDSEALGTSATAAAAGSFRMLGESSPAVGLFGGFDVALGGGGGFLYDLQLLGGLGFPIGHRWVIGVASGPGIDGITSTLPFGVSFPIETYLYIDVARAFDVAIAAENAWVLASDRRKDGSSTALFGDEFAASLSLGLGQRRGGSYSENRFGPLVGFGYREALGARFYELRLGFGAQESNFSGAY